MNHSDTEPDSDSDEESYVDCEEATVVSLLLSVRISFIAILRLIFYSHSDFSLQRRILKQRLNCLLLFKEN